MRCVALFSGGLDSQLATRLMQQQGIEVEGAHVATVYAPCEPRTVAAAQHLGIRLHQLAVGPDYLEVLERPRFGYGKGANPCIDCRIYMAKMAAGLMPQIDAHFVVTGEIIGQRPMSQKRRDLDIVAHHSGLDDLLLRPLSAKLLPATYPERQGWVDRSRLHGFSGRRRYDLAQLATALGLTEIPQPSTGCALTDKLFGVKAFDLLNTTASKTLWDFQSLRVGRHFRFQPDCKVIVGRDQTENAQLRDLHDAADARSTALLEPHDFLGPTVLIVGPATESAREYAGGLALRYARNKRGEHHQIQILDADGSRRFAAHTTPDSENAMPLGAQTPRPTEPC